MSDQLSDNRNKQPWLRHCSDQNDFTQSPPFNRHSYHTNHSATNRPEEHPPLHHRQPIDNFDKPPPTNNLRFRMSGRGGAKPYFRFHGGIGDGCGGVACRATEAHTAARPLQLFESLNSAHFYIDMHKKAYEGDFANPTTGKWVPPMESSTGTGVFLPAYQKKIGFNKVDEWKTNADGIGMYVGGDGRGQMKQDEETGLVVEEEGKEFDEIPIELLLPKEWTY